MAGGGVKGIALGVMAAGAVAAYAGFKGKSILSVVQQLVRGSSPATAKSSGLTINTQTASADVAAAAGSAVSGAANAKVSASGLANCVTVAKFLVSNGYSDAAAAGVAGCIYGESGGNPESIQDGKNGDPASNPSGGGGLIQWTPISAYPGLVTGNEQADFNTQLSAILDYNNRQGQGLVTELNAQTGPVAAADFYSQKFERPAVTNSDVNPAVATLVYATLKAGK